MSEHFIQDLSFTQPEVIIDGMTEFDQIFSFEPSSWPQLEQISSPEHLSGVSSSDTSSPLSMETPPTQMMSWQVETASVLPTQVVEEKPKSKRGRKKRVLDLTNPDISAVERNRDELLKISSFEFEENVQQLMKVRKLSDAEEAEVKRQRRLIKNRESAQNSRQKKKSEVEELEGQVKKLESENKHLETKVFELTKENAQLKSEVTKLRQLIQKTSGYLPNFDNFHTIGGSNSPSNTTTTTVVLFIMLFSFGLFVTNFSGVRTPSSFGPSTALVPKILELPSSASPSFADRGATAGGRALKSQEYIPAQTTQEYSTPAREVLQYVNYERTAPAGLNFDSCCGDQPGDNRLNNDNNPRSFDRRTKIVVNEEESARRQFAKPQVLATIPDAEPARIQAAIDVPNGKINTTLKNFFAEPNPLNLSKILEFDSDIVPRAQVYSQLLEHIEPRKNTAYFAISHLEQLFPEGADQMFDMTKPLQLSVLVTPEAISLPVGKEFQKKPIIEIITQVLAVNLPKNFDVGAIPILA